MPPPKALSGNVTFLFTDIVGSTEMWERHGDAFLPVLQAHNAILRDAVTRYGGHLFKEEGDAFKVAFSDPAAAVKCAVLAQAALQRYPWPEDVGALRVRMGVHSGTPFVQGSDYFGPPVNRTARILSTAHGGQVLISEDTRQRLVTELEPGVSLTDLGFHQLKDLDTPIRLFQVTHAALEQTSFPPPRSLNGHPHNLPPQRRSFVGREKEIEHIASRFASGDTRLLALTGPEGSGKTRLAVQASAEHIHLFPDGVYIVSLSNAVDLTGAAIEIADAMKIPLRPGAAPLDTVREYLANRSCLLILDDAGNVPQADRLIRELLTGAASLRCLATSRKPLESVVAEQLPVPELSRPSENAGPDDLMATDAGRLFVERAAEKRSDFEVTARNAPAIGRLLNRIIPTPANVENLADMLPQQSLSSLGDVLSRGAQLGKKAIAQTRDTVDRLRHSQTYAALQHSWAGALESADPDEAERHMQEALVSYHAIGDQHGVAESLRRLGNIAIQKRDFARAYKLLTAAHQMFIDLKSPESLSVRLDVDLARKGLGHHDAAPPIHVDEAIGMAMGD
jgi:class 3 adenylate cyclase